MIVVRANKFMGAVPGVAPQLLPQNAAQLAQNCKLVNGNMASVRDNAVVNTPTKVGSIKSIYRMGNVWLHFIADVDCLKGPIAGDTLNRTYFTEGGELRATNATMATAGGTEHPMDWFKIGVPAPASAPGVTLIGIADDPDDFANTESRTYIYCYVTAWGEEGPPSPASAIVDWNPGQTVSLSGFLGAPTGDYQITGLRVYRLQASAYRFLTDLAIPATTFSDDIASDTVGASEEIPSMDWYPPPAGMHSIVNHPSSFIIGAAGNELVVSEAGLPHAYNPFNRHTIPYDIVGLGISGQGVLILTGAGLWYAAGNEPDSFGPPEKIESDQACVSRGSIFEMDGATGFASPDGLYLYGIGVAKSLTEGLFTLDQWRNMNPQSMICEQHDGKIFVFYNNGDAGAFVIYPADMATKVDLDFSATALFSDKETDTLYMMVGSDIVAYEGGVITSTAVWKGSVVQPPYSCCPGAAKVRATVYPVTFNLYADGALKYTKSITSNAAFRLPGGYLADSFEVECEFSSGEILDIIVAESMADLRTV